MDLLKPIFPQKKIFVALALLLAVAYKFHIMSKFAELPRCMDGFL